MIRGDLLSFCRCEDVCVQHDDKRKRQTAFIVHAHRADRPAGKKHFENSQQLHNCKKRREKSQEQVGNIRKKEHRCFSLISKAEKNTPLEITVTTLAADVGQSQ